MPPIERTITSSSATRMPSCALIFISARQCRTPYSCSSGTGSRTRRASRSAVPAEAIVRAPDNASTNRAEILPCTFMYRSTIAVRSRANERTKTTKMGMPTTNAIASLGSISASATIAPTPGSRFVIARITSDATRPVSAELPTSRVATSPGAIRERGPTSSMRPTSDTRSHAVERALIAEGSQLQVRSDDRVIARCYARRDDHR